MAGTGHRGWYHFDTTLKPWDFRYRDKGSGNRLSEDNFEKSAFRRVLKFEFKSCNRLPLMCNRLPTTELLKFNLKSHDPSKYNFVINYQKPVIDY